MAKTSKRREMRSVQYLVVAAFFLAITLGTAAAWYIKATQLVMAISSESEDETRFANNLVKILQKKHGPVHIKLRQFKTQAEAVLALEHRDADLVILRSDGHVPANARALVILEHDVVLVLARQPPKPAPGKKPVPLPSLTEGKPITLISDLPQNTKMLQAILDAYDAQPAKQPITADTFLSGLNKGGNDIALTVVPLSRLLEEHNAQRYLGVALQTLDLSDALERKIPGLSAETIQAGLLWGEPRLPPEDIKTVGATRILVGRSRLSDEIVGNFMHFLFDYRKDLALDNGFASSIETPDTAKDARIPAHPAASDYIENAERDFFDRYGDALYLALSTGGILGSVGYTRRYVRQKRTVRRIDHLGDAIYELRARIRHGDNTDDIHKLEHELEDLVDWFLHALGEGNVSARGIERFRIGHEHAVQALEARRRKRVNP